MTGKGLLYRFICIILLVSFGASAYAQTEQIKRDTTVSLLTSYPGTDIYELEGHSAIRIIISDSIDYAVSYGMFDFNAPNFVYRFVKGETDYMVGAIPMYRFLNDYAESKRRVEEIPLNLSSTEKHKLIELLNENLRPENREYRYNYVKDNCATRPLKMIEMALDSPLVLGTTEWDKREKPSSYRDVMRSYHENYPWYQFGIDIALGSGIDYPLSSREYTFVPMLMAEQISGARVGNRKLAGEKRVLVDFPTDAALEPPTPLLLSPTPICWLIFLLLLLATYYDIKHGKVTRWVDAIYFGVLGLIGLLVTFLVFVSVHEATSPNWLIFWMNPFCLIPTAFIWLKKCNKVVLYYQFINFAVVFVLFIAWPLIPQSANAAFLPLVLGDLMRSGNYIYLKSDWLKKQKQNI